ncbi:MAG TPA: hypothetical protein VLY24_10905 [Bryobacteraceae bacterium]|nr:hypothetical protein [Bryobacteraceae bacterium]
MIAVDTSTWIAFLEGDGGKDTDALEDRQVLMVPAVFTEMLSDPKLSSEASKSAERFNARRRVNGMFPV